MTPVVRTVGFEDRGLVVVSPYATDFDARVLQVAPIEGSLALACKPFLTIIENRSTRPVVAYSVSFQSSAPDGWCWSNTVHFRYPRAVSSHDPACPVFRRGRELFPDEFRVIAPDFEVKPGPTSEDTSWIDFFSSRYRSEVVRSSEVEIGLDAVIFADGSKIGPDLAGLEHGFTTELAWMQRLLRCVVAGVDDGRPVRDAMDEAARLLPNHDDEADGLCADDVYPLVAFAELEDLRHELGDSAVPDVFRSAIRTTPLVVHRQM